VAPRRNFGNLSPTLMKLSLETNLPDPYEVSDGIVIPAPTRKRAKAMAEAEMERFLAQIALNQAYGRSQRPSPPKPSDATPEALAAWEVENAAWDDLKQASEDDLHAMTKRIQAADDAYNEAFFGGKYQDVVAFFDEQPPQLWDEFIADIQKKFGPKSAPADGKCPECGQVVDEEEAGKAPSSST
jgi:hypothetical protein